MSSREHNPLLALYGAPRSVVHSRISVRAKPVPPQCEQDDPDKVGNPMVTLISLKDHSPTSR